MSGDEELEALLRDQIRWALPIERRPVEAPSRGIKRTTTPK